MSPGATRASPRSTPRLLCLHRARHSPSVCAAAATLRDKDQKGHSSSRSGWTHPGLGAEGQLCPLQTACSMLAGCVCVTFLKGRINLLQLWLPFPEVPDPLGDACPREGEPRGCPQARGATRVAGAQVQMCVNHSRYRVTAQVPRAALAYSEAARSFTVACLPFARCWKRLLPTAAGPGSPRDQPVSRWPLLLHSARMPRHLPMEDALDPRPCPRKALAPGALGRQLL